jgi:hypothetical protein
MTAPNFAGLGIGGHHSSVAATADWLTPPAILAALGGADSFDLDPCTPDVQPWPTALRRYTKADDGLAQPWFGRVWLNPPYYANVIGKWLAKLADHDRGVTIIFARTETRAFFDQVWERASALLFLRGRLNFHYPDGTRAGANSGAPSVLCAYGQLDCDMLAGCGLEGAFVPLRFPRGVMVMALSKTWREAIGEWLTAHDGPVALSDLYRAFASHPKAKTNPHYREKIRQELQRGPFKRVGRGQWKAESSDAKVIEDMPAAT